MNDENGLIKIDQYSLLFRLGVNRLGFDNVIDVFGVGMEGVALQSLVVVNLGHLFDDPGFWVEPFLEDVGVMFREVAVVISQHIHIKNPYLIRVLQPLLSPQKLHLNDLLGLGLDQQLEEVACQFL